MKKCRCGGLNVIQDRFCGQFKKKAMTLKEGEKETLERNVFRRKLEKSDRLSRLADDFRRALFSQKGDIAILTKGGVSIPAHSFVLKSRTSIQIPPNTTEFSLAEFSSVVVEYYLLYVYSGTIEWSLSEMEDIKTLSILYGPTDLHLMMTQSDEVFNSPDELMSAFDDPQVTPPTLTMSEKSRKIAARFGSGVQVIKVCDITPAPDYEKYSDAQLKEALNQVGVRPLGRKRAIEMLNKIYDEVHPFYPPTPKRRASPISFNEQAGSSHDKNDDVLNESVEENAEESMFFEADETIGPSSNSPTKAAKRINDVDVGVKTMLEWLRLPENDDLYNNLLSFRTVNLAELMGTIERSSHAVHKITKKIFPDVLDKLYIGFYVPDKKWKRRAGYKSG